MIVLTTDYHYVNLNYMDTHEKKERNMAIIAKRKAGKSFNEIARIYNLSPQRIQSICKKYLPIDPNICSKCGRGLDNK